MLMGVDSATRDGAVRGGVVIVPPLTVGPIADKPVYLDSLRHVTRSGPSDERQDNILILVH